MLPVTSLQNPAIKLIRSLAEKKGRREHNLWMAEGHKMLERALSLDWQPVHFVATKPMQIWDDVKPLIVSEKIMAELSAQNNPHDVLAVFKQRYAPQPPRDGIVLAFEDIRDPGNLGTILRTADAAGVGGIVLAGDCCDPYSPDCVRASTGSIFASIIARMPTQKLADFITGWPGDSVATLGTASMDFRQTYKRPILIVLGSEARGLSPSLVNACSKRVSIPMRDGVESLNVATAAALMIYAV
jgi:RNA methyltransferase, TrmH family